MPNPPFALKVIPLTLTFISEGVAEFPEFPGSMLRGSLGKSLAKLLQSDGEPYRDKGFNLFNILYENALITTEKLDASGKLDRSQLRAGYWFNALDSGGKIHQKGDIISFGFTLCEPYLKYLPRIIESFNLMGQKGLGMYGKKGKFRLLYISASTADNNSYIVWNESAGIVCNNYQMISLSCFSNCEPSDDNIKLVFDTPTAHTNQISVYGSIPFQLLITSLCERLQELSLLYGDGSFKVSDINIDDAYRVKIDEIHLKRVFYERKSSARDHKEPIVGYTGEICYSGDKQLWKKYVPILLFGQYLHLGNHIVQGAGHYIVKNENHRFVR